MMVALVAVVVLATDDRGARLIAISHGALDSRFASLGLSLAVVHLQGASAPAQVEIMQAAGLKAGTPIFDLDLNAVRARVEKVGWVERARVIRLLPDTVVISVVERPLMAVWQHAGRSMVVANDGAVVGAVDPARFPRLPLIVGEGANLAAHDLLPQVSARPGLATKVSAAVRVDQRRWDLRLQDGGVIQLPANDETTALKTLDGLEVKNRVLGLGLARIDLRDPEMVVVRPRGGAAPVTTMRGT